MYKLVTFLLSLSIILGFVSLDILNLRVAAEENNNTQKKISIIEINWAGSKKSSNDEWIVLKNLTDDDIDITGYRLFGTRRGGGYFELTGIIRANNIFVVSRFNQGDPNTVINVNSNFVSSSFSISNAALNIKLEDSDGQIVDSVITTTRPRVGDSTSTPGTYFAMSRINPFNDGNDLNNWRNADKIYVMQIVEDGICRNYIGYSELIGKEFIDPADLCEGNTISPNESINLEFHTTANSLEIQINENTLSTDNINTNLFSVTVNSMVGSTNIVDSIDYVNGRYLSQYSSIFAYRFNDYMGSEYYKVSIQIKNISSFEYLIDKLDFFIDTGVINQNLSINLFNIHENINNYENNENNMLNFSGNDEYIESITPINQIIKDQNLMIYIDDLDLKDYNSGFIEIGNQRVPLVRFLNNNKVTLDNISANKLILDLKQDELASFTAINIELIDPNYIGDLPFDVSEYINSEVTTKIINNSIKFTNENYSHILTFEKNNVCGNYFVNICNISLVFKLEENILSSDQSVLKIKYGRTDYKVFNEKIFKFADFNQNQVEISFSFTENIDKLQIYSYKPIYLIQYRKFLSNQPNNVFETDFESIERLNISQGYESSNTEIRCRPVYFDMFYLTPDSSYITSVNISGLSKYRNYSLVKVYLFDNQGKIMLDEKITESELRNGAYETTPVLIDNNLRYYIYLVQICDYSTQNIPYWDNLEIQFTKK